MLNSASDLWTCYGNTCLVKLSRTNSFIESTDIPWNMFQKEDISDLKSSGSTLVLKLMFSISFGHLTYPVINSTYL